MFFDALYVLRVDGDGFERGYGLAPRKWEQRKLPKDGSAPEHTGYSLLSKSPMLGSEK